MRAPPNLAAGGTQAANSQWWNNPLGDCYWSDRIWGNAVCMAEYLDSTPGHTRDPVLHGLMQIGVQDWRGTNRMGIGSSEAVRHTTSMVARVSGTVYALEEKVHSRSSSSYGHKD